MSNSVIKNILPYGEKLRVLLSHSELSSSNHRTILNSKGVFLSNYDKNNTVPALMTTLLDPTEFYELMEMQSQKEDSEKSRTLQLPWKGGNDLIQTIPKELNLNNLIKSNTNYKPTYKIIGNPQFVRVNSQKDVISLDFEIERENNTKGWDERKTIHKGSINISLTDKNNLQLITKKTHTSKETLETGELLLKYLKSHYKANSWTDKDADFERILFNHFINENRISFFFALTGELHFGVEFDKLINITIGPDPSTNIHQDLKEFLKDIENVKIKGKALQSHMIIAKTQYHPNLIFSSMLAKYNFKLSEGNGSFIVEYTFNEYEESKNPKSEFQFFIQRINLDKGYSQISNKEKIRKILNTAIETKKLEFYNNFKS